MSPYPDAIPEFLFTPASALRKKWRSIARVLLKGAQWDEAMHGVQWRNADELPGQFHLMRLMAKAFQGGSPIWVVREILFDEAFVLLKDREEIYQQLKRIVLSGLDDLWFGIAMLCGMGFPQGTSYDQELPSLSAQMVSGHLRHWTWYCDNEHRFSSPIDLGLMGPPETPNLETRWRYWGMHARGLIQDMGVSKEIVKALWDIPAREAGERMKDLVDAFWKSAGSLPAE